MNGRVLSTPEAKDAATRIKAIVSGGLTEQVTQLRQQGQTLSNPNLWDGAKAGQFQGDVWPQTEAALTHMLEALGTLQLQVDAILTDIFAAGN